MSAPRKAEAAPKTLGALLAELGFDNPDLRLDDPELDRKIAAVLGEAPLKAVQVATPSGPRVRTAEEQALIDRVKARQSEHLPLPRWSAKLNRRGKIEIAPEGPDHELAKAQMIEAFGLRYFTSVAPILERLAVHSSSNGLPHERRFNELLAMVASAGPRDELECNLAVEMALIHDAMMTMAAALPHTETLPQQETVANALNKLARTFALQLETLKRLRSTGQQQVVIKRIEVKEGGQAMVGALGDVGGRSHAGHVVRKRPSRALPPPEARLELPLPLNETRSPQPVTIDMNPSDDQTR